MKYLWTLILFAGCSVNLDIEFPKPKVESCEKDCEIYRTFQEQYAGYEDDKDPYCVCMDDCMDGTDYDWVKECPRLEFE